ncbi:unnamed protein product [Pleuronectes platessa]|uniref:Cytosolic carboxypeptidase N-terminal domain-containing protein n=1 Tax=Pleuronectes platessa TaxID=8262 RepID=A0A9N7V6C9_PLEPL|nr:unnamed protein product [Pleuronectes platessa]
MFQPHQISVVDLRSGANHPLSPQAVTAPSAAPSRGLAGTLLPDAFGCLKMCAGVFSVHLYAGVSQGKKFTLSELAQRLPAKNVYYYRCPDHRRNYVMSFAFCFDREDDVYQFAYCYPYTYSRLQHYLASLERRNLPYLQREQLGLSVQSSHLGSRS